MWSIIARRGLFSDDGDSDGNDDDGAGHRVI